jgi:hypothetical protein
VLQEINRHDIAEILLEKKSKICFIAAINNFG